MSSPQLLTLKLSSVLDSAAVFAPAALPALEAAELAAAASRGIARRTSMTDPSVHIDEPPPSIPLRSLSNEEGARISHLLEAGAASLNVVSVRALLEVFGKHPASAIQSDGSSPWQQRDVNHLRVFLFGKEGFTQTTPLFVAGVVSCKIVICRSEMADPSVLAALPLLTTRGHFRRRRSGQDARRNLAKCSSLAPCLNSQHLLHSERCLPRPTFLARPAQALSPIHPTALGTQTSSKSSEAIRNAAALAQHLCRACGHLEVIEICCAAGEDEAIWRDGLERIKSEAEKDGKVAGWWERLEVVSRAAEDDKR